MKAVGTVSNIPSSVAVQIQQSGSCSHRIHFTCKLDTLNQTISRTLPIKELYGAINGRNMRRALEL